MTDALSGFPGDRPMRAREIFGPEDICDDCGLPMIGHTGIDTADGWKYDCPTVDDGGHDDLPVRQDEQPAGISTDLSGGKFLATYFAGTRGEIYIGVIRNGDSQLERGEVDRLITRSPGSIDKFIAEHDKPELETAIYFTTASLKPGETRRNAATCWEFTSIFADIDDHGHELDRARVIELLEGLPCPPTLIVNSGHGLQPHWLFDQRCEDFKRIEAARKRLHEITASDAVYDAPRFMRLPGSHNSKRGDWLAVEVVSFHPDLRYPLEALEQWLAEATIIIPRKLKAAKTNDAAQVEFVLPPASTGTIGPGTDRKRGEAWARAALDASCAELANAGGPTSRHDTLRDKACRMGTMVARGWIDVFEVRRGLYAASQQCGQIKDYGEKHFDDTFAAGISYGAKYPHPDLPDSSHQQQRHDAATVDSRDALGSQADIEPETPTAFDLAPYAFPDPASIPRRQWLYGRHYIRSAVGASIGAPGRLKSTTVLTEIIGMTVGRDLMSGEPLPSGPLRAAYLNGEEVQEELDRRVAAICQRFGLKPQDCGDRLWVLSTRDKPIRVAVRSPRGDAMVQRDAVAGLADWCDRNQIDALAIDPLISFHSVRESDNGDMDLVCKEAFGVIAGKTRAVDLVHHPRKLPPGESNTTVDDARGASALLGAVRVARTFNFMTVAEAGQIGIVEDVRRLHVRIENGKNNPGPIGKAHWVKIETEILPNGDEVAVATLWKPPNPFDGVSVNDLKVVQRVVQGGAFRTDSQSPQWLGWWMAENLPGLNIKTRHTDKPRNKAEVARLNSILKTWLKNNALEIETRMDAKSKARDFFIAGKPIEPPHSAATAENNDDQIILQ